MYDRLFKISPGIYKCCGEKREKKDISVSVNKLARHYVDKVIWHKKFVSYKTLIKYNHTFTKLHLQHQLLSIAGGLRILKADFDIGLIKVTEPFNGIKDMEEFLLWA